MLMFLLRVLPLELDLMGTLIKASLDLVSATYPSFHKPSVLHWLSMAFKLPSGIPETLPMLDESCLP